MTNGINILDDKHVQFRQWLDFITERRGLDSTLTVREVLRMLDFLDAAEMKTDDIILEAFE